MALSNTSDHSDQFGRYATIYGVAMILSTQNDASCRNDRPVSDARAVKYSRFGSDPTIVPDPNSFVCQSLFPDRSSGIRKNMILRMHADKIPDQHVVSDRDTAYATVKAVRAKSRTIAYAQTLSDVAECGGTLDSSRLSHAHIVSQYDAVLRQSVQIGSAVDSYVSSCPQFSGATYLDTGRSE